jgi:hypothetical protein
VDERRTLRGCRRWYGYSAARRTLRRAIRFRLARLRVEHARRYRLRRHRRGEAANDFGKCYGALIRTAARSWLGRRII